MKKWGMLVPALLVWLGGCAGSRVVELNPAVAQPDSLDMAQTLRVGSDIKIFLTNGTTRTGTLQAITAEGLILGKPSNYGLDETLYTYDRITRIEAPPQTGVVSDVVGGVVLSLTVTAVVLMALTAYALRDGVGCN